MADVQHWLYGTIDLLPLKKLVLVYDTMCSLLGSHLGFSKYILMAVPCRFIHKLEVAIDKKTCS